MSMERDENVIYQLIEGDDQNVDWKGRKANPRKHGGIRAAAFACVVVIFTNMAFLSNATNFVTYFRMSMQYPPATSANMVTNFIGTSYLITILGGFVSDSLLTRYTTFIIFCTIELLGLILLTIQAQYLNFRLAINAKPSQSQAAILYTGLYAIATGVGGINASLPAHGADQLDHSNQTLISAFFNWFFFSLCLGSLMSSTIMIWVEENKGWNWSFTITVIALSLALLIFIVGNPFYRHKRPSGSALTGLFKLETGKPHRMTGWRTSLNFEASALNPTELIYDPTTSSIEESRTVVGLLPIFASTIMMNCCVAQFHTFSVTQGSIMNRKVHNIKIPTQSLSVPPLSVMLASIPLFERFQRILGNNHSGRSYVFQPLWRMGLGLALASVPMAVAALVEAKRREAAENNVTLSVFWLGWQYLLIGVSELFAVGGMFEFFYSEAPNSMRSMSTSLLWCSASLGYFLSSVLVSIANSLSGRFGKEWLGGNDVNHTRLDLFYTLLSILNSLNFLNYKYWAMRY